MADFRLCSSCHSRSQAGLCHCTQQPMSDRPEPTIARLRYCLGGDRPSLSPAVDAMKKRGFRCEGALCDVSKPAEIDAVVKQTLATYDQIDILDRKSGVTWGAPAEAMPFDKWQQVL